MAHIFIVDDDARVSEAARHQLSGAGHDCTVIPNGADAIDAISSSEADLVILDVMLPGASGFEVCRSIRRSTQTYKLPIIFVSAMGGEEEILHGLAQGADDYLVKPIDLRTLGQRVDALLRAHGKGTDIDTITKLPSGDSTKREIQRRVIKNRPFSLGYAELVGLREFSFHCGPEAREKAIRHFARALTGVAKELDCAKYFVGHMGGGHFVFMCEEQVAKPYSEAIKQVWDKHVDELYAAVGKSNLLDADTAERAKYKQLDVLCCVTNHGTKSRDTPQDMFETLTHIRTRALNHAQSGVFVDQRH